MADIEFNWPKKGDRAFKPSVRSADQAEPEAFVAPSDGTYLVGFQRAADMIVDAAKTDDRNPDDLFFPVAYLYRHHLELMLMGLVSLGVRVGSLDECEDILGEHALVPLWSKAKQLIQEVCPDSPPEDLEAAGAVIQEFHRLDKSGQVFRYARDKHGKPHLQNGPKRVDLAKLKKRVDSVSNFLDAAWAGIDYCDQG